MTYHLPFTIRLIGSISASLLAFSVATTALAADVDGDGVREEDGDCDDNNAQRSPNVAEVCNGLDDDCSGIADDIIAPVFADTDGDGYGDPDESSETCQPGFVANSGDCDDDDPYTHPGAFDDADANDTDCDGSVDEDHLVDDGGPGDIPNGISAGLLGLWMVVGAWRRRGLSRTQG